MGGLDTKASVRLTRFSDRWDYIDRLFKELDSEKWRSLPRTNFELRLNDQWPRRIWCYSHSGSQIGWDQDHVAGLNDYWQPYANHLLEHQPDSSLQGNIIGDSVTRDKVYIYDEGRTYSEEMLEAFPSLNYFIRMREEFLSDVLAKTGYFENQNIKQFKPCLMLVKYDVPENVDYHSYMHWNFEQFGNEHCDENLGALHLGENQTAFFAIDGEEKKNFPELKHANTFWSWGDYAKHSGKTPTIHGVEYFGGNGPRYSIIYNLECEYN